MTNDPQTANFAPLAPLAPPDPRLWRKIKRGAKGPRYALGNRAVVEETTGQKVAEFQRWTWQLIRFGAAQPAVERTRAEAMRAAEFALGLGEMEVEK